MHWGPRNLVYLRISRSSVLETTIFLDPCREHLEWMKDETLQLVLAVLRERLPGKLAALQSGSTTGVTASVDVYRGQGFQFAWYLRKLDKRHAILLKDRQVDFGEDQEDHVDEDRKPRKRTRYTGFSIYGHQLVIIVEPYPPLPKTSSANDDDFNLDGPKAQGQLVKEVVAEPEEEAERARALGAKRQALSIQDFLKANAEQRRTGRDVERTTRTATATATTTSTSMSAADSGSEQLQELVGEGESVREPVQGLLDGQLGLGQFEDQSVS